MRVQQFILFSLFITFNIYAQDACLELTEDDKVYIKEILFTTIFSLFKDV